MAHVGGTISGTGPTTPINGTKIKIKMDFSGTATVDVEFQMGGSGNWVKFPDATGIVADYYKVFDSPIEETIRLNCTAFTNNVEYSLTTN